VDTSQIILLLFILAVLVLVCFPAGITPASRRHRAHCAKLASRNDAWTAAHNARKPSTDKTVDQQLARVGPSCHNQL
jgi:hypothetical protein